jgi:hypothetical protein
MSRIDVARHDREQLDVFVAQCAYKVVGGIDDFQLGKVRFSMRSSDHLLLQAAGLFFSSKALAFAQKLCCNAVQQYGRCAAT